MYLPRMDLYEKRGEPAPAPLPILIVLRFRGLERNPKPQPHGESEVQPQSKLDDSRTLGAWIENNAE